jgi:hypothetical protein
MRIELAAPTDLGRDALRTILADLRRDLVVAAPHATLSLSSQGSGDQPTSSQSGGAFTASHGQTSQNQPGPQSTGPQTDRTSGRDDSGAPATAEGSGIRTSPSFTTPHGGIDVFA